MKNKTLTDNLQDLPKWAQSEISILQMRLKESKQEILRMTENPVSNTVLGSNYEFQGEKIKYLTNNQRISFIFPNGTIEAVINGDVLEIRASHLESRSDMLIKPIVSNSFEVHIKS